MRGEGDTAPRTVGEVLKQTFVVGGARLACLPLKTRATIQTKDNVRLATYLEIIENASRLATVAEVRDLAAVELGGVGGVMDLRAKTLQISVIGKVPHGPKATHEEDSIKAIAFHILESDRLSNEFLGIL